MAQAAESTLKDQEASDRVKVAQLMGLAAQGYNVANTINNVAALPSNGVNQGKAELFRAEFGVGMSHSRASQVSEAQISQGNTVNAKQIEITARSGDINVTQTDFVSRGENGERLQNSRISLNAAQNILLQAGESHQKQQGKNQSYGTEVGTAFSVGAKTGWSFYAKEGFSKGKEESEQRIYENSHLDSEHITLSSGKDTTLSLFDLSSPSARLIVGANGIVSAGSQYVANGEISLKDTAKDMAETYITKGFGFKTYTVWNLGTGFVEGGLENAKWQDGRLQGFSVENGLERASAKTVTSTLGMGLVKELKAH